jgi:predicted AlkP superfamily phosphohydrolase/phosphomutase
MDSTRLRRVAAAAAFATSAGLATTACAPPKTDTKVIVLGFDGMDPRFLEKHRDRLPNLMRLAQQGGFEDLETIMPPQSPVAWSTVITGMTPAGHGIYDFVHRHPEDETPFSSMAKANPPGLTLEIGDYAFPLSGGETVPLRKGPAFWDYLTEANINTIVMKMPTDFPPRPGTQGSISGMGTPDMLGTFGTFQFFTDDPDEFVVEEVSGGEVYRVEVESNRVVTKLHGPHNDFRKERERIEVPLVAELDPEADAARIELGGNVVVLAEGQWSDWLQLDFELIPALSSASGIVRLYLKEARPHFKLYVSPINIDPKNAAVAISEPPEFAATLAETVGPFYTQGMAEETKGLSSHLLSRDEFVVQANIVMGEEIELYEHLLSQYEGGMMFNYFSTTDQAAHMLWGDYEDDLVHIYERADAVVGKTLDTIGDDTTLIVMSDHGFARFDKQVNLNTWLMEEGFLVLDDPDNVSRTPGFAHVDWSQTRAYAMGLNGLYVNLRGREQNGIVAEAEVEALRGEIEERLLKFVDPDTEERVVEKLYDTRSIYEGNETEFAPDFLVGFFPPYRMSPETGLGAVPAVTIERNPDEWIGDHCMSHERVPGVILSNRPISVDDPSLLDIPVTILSAFGLDVPSQMSGRNVLGDSN